MFAFTVFRCGLVGVILMLLPLSTWFGLRPTPRGLLMTARLEQVASIWVRDLERGVEHMLAGPVRGLEYSWSPDGRWLLLAEYGEASNSYTAIDLIYGTREPLSDRAWAVPPVWSPDSRYALLFYRTPSATTETYYARVTGDGLSSLSALDATSLDVLWSPDGDQLYYRDFLGGLGSAPADCLTTGEPCVRSLTPVERQVNQLAGWMPDGETMMVIASSPETGAPQIYSLDPQTGALDLLIENPLPGVTPVWSPDGRWLAASLAVYTDVDADPADEPIPSVYLLDPASDQHELLWTGVAGQLGWSPSGEYLAFELVSRVDSSRSVYVYEHSIGRVRRLTNGSVLETRPTWGRYPGQPFDVWLAGVVVLFLTLVVWRTGRLRPARMQGNSESRS